MKIIRLYNSIVLPNSKIFLKSEYAKALDGSYLEINDELFILIEKNKNYDVIKKDNFYDLGVSGKVIDKENGIVTIETENRIKIEYIDEISTGKYEIKITKLESINDITKEEEDLKVEKIKNEIISFVGKYEWGFFALSEVLVFR
jgi:ATP-dependent Lon protease